MLNYIFFRTVAELVRRIDSLHQAATSGRANQLLFKDVCNVHNSTLMLRRQFYISEGTGTLNPELRIQIF